MAAQPEHLEKPESRAARVVRSEDASQGINPPIKTSAAAGMAFEHSLALDGDNDYVSIPYNSALRPLGPATIATVTTPRNLRSRLQ